VPVTPTCGERMSSDVIACWWLLVSPQAHTATYCDGTAIYRRYNSKLHCWDFKQHPSLYYPRPRQRVPFLVCISAQRFLACGLYADHPDVPKSCRWTNHCEVLHSDRYLSRRLHFSTTPVSGPPVQSSTLHYSVHHGQEEADWRVQ
jgi:hypothetical protein